MGGVIHPACCLPLGHRRDESAPLLDIPFSDLLDRRDIKDYVRLA